VTDHGAAPAGGLKVSLGKDLVSGGWLADDLFRHLPASRRSHDPSNLPSRTAEQQADFPDL